MSIKQFVMLSEQNTRSTPLGDPLYQKFYPISGKLEPDVEYKEDPVKEWRGQDTSQGDVSDERTSTSWKYSMEGRIYACPELELLLRYLFGTYSTPVALPGGNAQAFRTIYKSASEMFGADAQLLDKALTLIPNSRKGANTYSQSYIGGRIESGEFDFKGGEAASMKLNFIGGPWIGAPEQTASPNFAQPRAKAFRSTPRVYLGSGATLSGEAPNYTDFAPGSMPVVSPDDLTIKIEPGVEDVYKMNGIEGPSVTERKKQWMVTIEFTVDFADPASGWSSYDAWAARFSDIQYAPFMMTLNSTELIYGCSTQTYELGLYLPKVKIITETVDRKNDGSKEKIKVKLESRVEPNINVAAYGKLIYGYAQLPQITEFVMPDSSNSLTIPITTLTGVGASLYCVSNSSATPDPVTGGLTGWQPLGLEGLTEVTVAAAGSHTLYAWGKDDLGSISSLYPPQICTADATRPSVSSFAASSPVTIYPPFNDPENQNWIPITAFTASDNLAVAGYQVTYTNTPPAADEGIWQSAPNTNVEYNGSAPATVTLYPWVKDAVGNVSLVYGTPASVSLVSGG